MATWREVAGSVIWPIVEVGLKAGRAPEDILRDIDAAYPFFQRRYHPL